MTVLPDPNQYKGKYLIEEPPLMFQPSLAVIFGLNAAVILQQIYWWMRNPFHKGKLATRIDADGRMWVKIPPEVLDDKFPFISVATRNRTFEHCKKEGLLRTSKFDRNRNDQTNYYHVVLDEIIRREEAFEEQKKSEQEQESGTDTPPPNESASRYYQNDKIHSLTHHRGEHSIKMSESTVDQSDQMDTLSDCEDVQLLKSSDCNVPKKERKDKKQQQKGNAAAANFQQQDFSKDELGPIVEAALALDTGVAESLLKELIAKRPQEAARLVAQFPDRPQHNADYCAKHGTTRAACLVSMLRNPARWADEPPAARRRREAAEKLQAAAAERRAQAEAKRLEREEERRISALRRKDAGMIYNMWLPLGEEAKRKIQLDIERLNKPIADLVASRGGLEALEKGGPTWLSYLEAVSMVIQDAIEEFPLQSGANIAEPLIVPGDNSEDDEGEFFEEPPPVDAREHKVALLANEILAGRIDPRNIVRGELDAWAFGPEQWAEICQEARKRAGVEL